MKNSSFSEGYTEDIVREYSLMLAKIAFTYTKNTADAEDVAQEVLLRLLEKRPTFKSKEHEKAWLIRVAINESINKFRIAKRTELSEESEIFAEEAEEEDRTVINAVLSLPEKYRIVIYLFYYEGYSVKEIAHTLGKDVSTVTTRLSRGREKLGEILKGEFEDE